MSEAKIIRNDNFIDLLVFINDILCAPWGSQTYSERMTISC